MQTTCNEWSVLFYVFFIYETIKKRGSKMSDITLFKNGYGVSIICNEFSKGLELAVLKWNGIWDNTTNKPMKVNSYDLTYDTPITDDTLGNLNADALKETVDRVKALDGKVKE
tara:strand:- start:16 stop:354 length:339 start_codon:yes stop_codon:yes gene_type:complete